MPTIAKASALLLGLALVCAGCAKLDSSSRTSALNLDSSVVTFSVIYPGGDVSHKQAISTAIAAFEQSHPNILISEGNETWAGTYTDFLKSKVAVGEFPDLVELRETDLFAEAGLLQEMPEELTYPLATVTKTLGKVYTLPLERTAPQGIIYNRRLFREAGIAAAPRTYEEFLTDNDRLKRLGVVPLVVGGKDVWHLGFWINKFMIDEVYARDPHWNRKRSEGIVSWTDPEPARAMEKLVQLWKRGDVVSDYAATTDSQTVSRLVSGDAAMLFAGPWKFNQIQSVDPGFSFGFFALPDEDGHVNLAGAPSSNGWAISAQAGKDPDKLLAIRQFLTFFYDDHQYDEYLQTVNGLSAKKGAADEPKSAAMGALLKALEDPGTTLVSQMDYYGGADALPPSFRDWFYNKIMSVLSGTENLGSALREADREWDREIGEENGAGEAE